MRRLARALSREVVSQTGHRVRAHFRQRRTPALLRTRPCWPVKGPVLPQVARWRGLAPIGVHQVRPTSCSRGRGALSREPGLSCRALGDAIDGFRAGVLDAFDVDEVLFQYSRAAKELWNFCNLGDPEPAANMILERPVVAWWERGAPRKR